MSEASTAGARLPSRHVNFAKYSNPIGAAGSKALPDMRKKHRLTSEALLNQLYLEVAFFRASSASSLPSAVRVFLGRCAIVLFRRLALAAFLMFRFAAAHCFFVVPISGNQIWPGCSSARREPATS